MMGPFPKAGRYLVVISVILTRYWCVCLSIGPPVVSSRISRGGAQENSMVMNNNAWMKPVTVTAYTLLL